MGTVSGGRGVIGGHEADIELGGFEQLELLQRRVVHLHHRVQRPCRPAALENFLDRMPKLYSRI